MSILFYYSLLLSGALLLMWVACRTVRGRDLVLGRGAILSAIGLAVLASALPILIAKPVEIVVGTDFSRPLAVMADTGSGTNLATPTPEFSWWEMLRKVYIIGVAVSLLLLFVTIARIARIIIRSEAHGNIRLHDDSSLVPFAWGKWVIMSRSDYEAEGSMLLAHEAAHLRGMHWVDLLAMSLLQCITWYCPAVRLLRGELLAAHEYIADKAVLCRGFSAPDYQILLISKASGRRFANSVTACINHVSLKNRILMMQNQTNPGRVARRALALIPAGLLMVALALIPALSSKASEFLPVKIVTEKAVAVPVENNFETIAETPVAEEAVVAPVETNSAPVNKTSETGENVATPETQVAEESVAAPLEIESSTPTISEASADPKDDDDKVFDAVECPPKYPGGEFALYKYVIEHIQYPANAKAKNIKGRVILRFVVKKDGRVGDVEVMRGVDSELDAEAVRVVKTLPKFTPATQDGKPVNVYYVLPVAFKISSDKK